jgi:hypothetical protein
MWWSFSVGATVAWARERVHTIMQVVVVVVDDVDDDFH